MGEFSTFSTSGEDSIYINHNGIVYDTGKAVLFWIRGKKVWIPSANITTMDKKIVGIKKWYADKNNMKGDW